MRASYKLDRFSPEGAPMAEGAKVIAGSAEEAKAKATALFPERPGDTFEIREVSTMQPMGDKVLLSSMEEAETRRGLIIIPDNARGQSKTFEVVAVGPGRKTKTGARILIPVKPGDRVLIGMYLGVDIEVGDTMFRLMPEEGILAIIHEEAA
jgi:co-chaperonin GroES (HSP10)